MDHNSENGGENGNKGRAIGKEIPSNHQATYLDKIKADSTLVFAHLEKLFVRDDGKLVVPIATHLIRWSRYANRHESAFKTDEFTTLREAIRERGGNTQAIVVRPVFNLSSAVRSNNADEAIYEIVSGHRRHQACRELGLPVRAIVEAGMSDREMVMSMYDENDARAGISAFEAGTMYSTWLKEKLFSSQNKLALAIKKQRSDVSRALFLAKLPQVVCLAFESPLVLQYKDADELKKILSTNKPAVLRVAKELSGETKKKKRVEVIRLLKEASTGKNVGSTNTLRKVELLYDEQPVGSIIWDADGRGRLTLVKTLAEEGQKVFEDLLSDLISKVFDGACIDRSATVEKSEHDFPCLI